MHENDLMDTDGENKAMRSFLRFYLKPGITIGEMRENLASEGWEGYWPDSIGAADWTSTLTKFEAQAWLRHLFNLEVGAEQLPERARDQAGAAVVPVLAEVATRIAASGSEIIKLLGYVEARVGESLETDGIHQQVAYINRVLSELPQGRVVAEPVTRQDLPMVRFPVVRGDTDIGKAVRHVICSALKRAQREVTGGSDRHVAKTIFSAVYAYCASHQQEINSLGELDSISMPGELDNELMDSVVQALREALKPNRWEASKHDYFVAGDMYSGLIPCLNAAANRRYIAKENRLATAKNAAKAEAKHDAAATKPKTTKAAKGEAAPEKMNLT